jgi:hypothetical protein
MSEMITEENSSPLLASSEPEGAEEGDLQLASTGESVRISC